MSDFDIRIEGRGYWSMIHMLAYYAITEPLKQSFLLTINQLSEHFGCEKCRMHLVNYMKIVPIKNYWYSERGLFKWTWELHNHVNQRLNKPLITLEDALNRYKNFVCQHCDDDVLQPVQPVQPIQPSIKSSILVPVDPEDKTVNILNLISYY